jgi:hypothetical protein
LFDPFVDRFVAYIQIFANVIDRQPSLIHSLRPSLIMFSVKARRSPGNPNTVPQINLHKLHWQITKSSALCQLVSAFPKNGLIVVGDTFAVLKRMHGVSPYSTDD